MSDKDVMLNRAARLSQSSLHRTAREAADRASGLVDHTIWLALDALTLDDRIQVRVDGLDQATVERYATVMQENGAYDPFPAVVVFREGETFWLSAGFHRVAAARQAGLTDVRADVRPGGFEAAYWHAITDNLANGLQMNYADQKEALRRLLGLDVDVADAQDYITMSDRQLAGIIGVSRTTISKWRSELARSTGNRLPVDQVRMGADGKIRDVSGIQTANLGRKKTTKRTKQVGDPDSSLSSDDSENESGSYTEGTRILSKLLDDIQDVDPDDADSRVRQLVDLVSVLSETAVRVANAIEDYLPLDEAADPTLRALRGHINDALDYLTGFEDARHHRRAGAVELLDRVRRDLGG